MLFGDFFPHVFGRNHSHSYGNHPPHQVFYLPAARGFLSSVRDWTVLGYFGRYRAGTDSKVVRKPSYFFDDLTLAVRLAPPEGQL